MSVNLKFRETKSKSPIIERNKEEFTIKIKTSKLKQLKNEVRSSKESFHTNSLREKNIFLKRATTNNISRVQRRYNKLNFNENQAVGLNNESKSNFSSVVAEKRYDLTESHQAVGLNNESKSNFSSVVAEKRYDLKESRQSIESKLTDANKYNVKESRQSVGSKIVDKKNFDSKESNHGFKSKRLNKSDYKSNNGVIQKVDGAVNLLKENNEEQNNLTSDIKESAIKTYESSRQSYEGLKTFKQFISSKDKNRKLFSTTVKDGSRYLIHSTIKNAENELKNMIEEDQGSLDYTVRKNASVTYRTGKKSFRYVKELSSVNKGSYTTRSTFSKRISEFRKKNQLRKRYKMQQMASQYMSQAIKSILSKKGLEKLTVSIMSNPVLFLIGIVVALVLVIIPVCFASFSSPMGVVIQADEKQISEFHLYVSQLDQDLQNEIQSEINGTTSLLVVYDFSNLNTNSYDLLAYFSTKYPIFQLEDIKEEIKKFHHELYTVKRKTINNELQVSVESVSVNDYLTLNKDKLFASGEYELYLMYLEYGLMAYESELAPPYDGTYRYSSRFGYRTNPVTGVQEFHTGLDIPNTLGTPIKAVMSGTVTKVGYDDDGYGNYLVIKDGNRETLYAHCQKVLVQVGQIIRVGDKIALTGSTGMSTGPHLHLEYKKDGQRLNPEYYLPKIE